jgi:X-Pro dipeptidyl-peptidase (S15 family)
VIEDGRSREVRLESDVPAVMRDGTILRADVYAPNSGGLFPCVLHRTPYGKEGRFSPGPLAESIAEHGYIVIVQDIRGPLLHAPARPLPSGRRKGYASDGPSEIASADAEELERKTDYLPVDWRGAERAAQLIADLF